MIIPLALLLSVTDPAYMRPLFDHFLGRAMLVLSAAMVTIGSVLIGKIIDIKA